MGDFDDVRERGLAVRREMFGPPGSDDAVRNASNFAAPFHEILSRYCFGEFWTRDGLGRRDRSMLTLAMLIALNREQEIKIHVRGALANAVKPSEIQELILHAIPYCGIPAALGGMRAAEEALAAAGESL